MASFKTDLLNELYTPLRGATQCPVGTDACTKIVFGVGDPLAKIMFIGEAPGRNEDAQGEPFVGRSGQLLNKCLNVAGIKRENVFITNIVKCRPPDNRKPLPSEVAFYKPILLREIKIIRPAVICTLGSSSLEALTNSTFSMTKIRGKILSFAGTDLIPTFHPAYVLRNPAALSDLQNDLIKVVKHAYGTSNT